MVARCHCHDQATEFVEGHTFVICVFKAERAFGDTLQVRIEESEGSLDECLFEDFWFLRSRMDFLSPFLLHSRIGF